MDLLWEHPGDLQHDQRVQHVAKALNLPPAVALVLVGNGIDTPEAAQAFFHPEVTQFHDPLLMEDMACATSCLVEALYERRRIVLFGDYDVDGVTSVALLYLFLKDIGGDVVYHIPERNSEGYGLSIDAVRSAREHGGEVLLTVDTGITAVDEIAFARELGLEVIVCDHHQPGESLPVATAILNPKRHECSYPFKELAAVGVAFKLGQSLVRGLELDAEMIYRYLDLAAIGSAADIVPLTGENRVMVGLGLRKLNKEPQVGVGALLQVSGLLRREVNVSSVVFGLAPRINAVGRLGSAERAVRLLTTKNRETARDIARVLEHENRQRKSIDHGTLDEAVEKVEQECDLGQDKVIVLDKRNWHSGVIGIVASRIIERHHRPTVMITVDDSGLGKGSARSISGFDVYEALRSCEDLLEQFGGHKYAAGLTVREENIPELRRRLKHYCDSRLCLSDLNPRLRIDAEIPLRMVDREFLEALKLFAPFGPKNQQPHFLTRSAVIKGEARVVGSGHLVCRVEKEGIEFDAIGYGLGHLAEELELSDGGVDMVYAVIENVWRGRSGIQLHLKDICPAGTRQIVTRAVPEVA